MTEIKIEKEPVRKYLNFDFQLDPDEFGPPMSFLVYVRFAEYVSSIKMLRRFADITLDTTPGYGEIAVIAGEIDGKVMVVVKADEGNPLNAGEIAHQIGTWLGGGGGGNENLGQASSKSLEALEDVIFSADEIVKYLAERWRQENLNEDED